MSSFPNKEGKERGKTVIGGYVIKNSNRGDVVFQKDSLREVDEERQLQGGIYGKKDSHRGMDAKKKVTGE